MLLLRSDFCKHQFDSTGGGDNTRSQNFSAFLLKGGILRSSNNIQDRLCDLRKYVHFCTKRLHGFNETEKKCGKGYAHVSPRTEDERITPKRASDDRFIKESDPPT
jgi:hypothetical protein